MNNPVNKSDLEGNWPGWVKKVAIGAAVIVAVAVVAVATAGTGTAAACFAAGALKGALVGGAVGAVVGGITSAVKHRINTGSWKGAGTAIRDGAADGFMRGAIGGAVTGGITSNVCFVEGTAVLTATGYVMIEEISSGDKVWSQNPETGEKELKKVVQTFKNETDELVHVWANGEEIVSTPEHPFYVPRKGWIGAIDLRAGDLLLLKDDGYIVVEMIQHEILESPIAVYNFEVEDFHTYYVGIETILVHNSCLQRGVGGKGWMGDKTWRENLRTIDSGGTITSLNGGVPTLSEAKELINQIGGTILRVEQGHAFPNPHNFRHINGLGVKT